MSEHPIDLLPGYVLGALNPDEASFVAEHLRTCRECRAEAEEFRATVSMLPYASPSAQPPARVKRQLMARIAASQEPQPEPVRLPPVRNNRARWFGGLAAVAVAGALALGAVTLDARQQLVALSAALGQSQQQVAQLQAEHDAATAFIAAPQTVSRSLAPQINGLTGRMYMQPGHNRVVLVINGLPPPPAGSIYQFWFANSKGQVPSEVFRSANGVTELVIDAPGAADSYTAVMVTVERDGGSRTPSNEVVLAGEAQS